MQFYNASTKQGLLQEIDALCDTTDTSYTRQEKTRRVNTALEELVSEIITADGTWQYDDRNQADLPVGTATLIEGQQTYSFDVEYLQIESIEILSLDGNSYRRINTIDNVELGGASPDEYFGVESNGDPKKGPVQWYDINGDTIRLYNTPTSASTTLISGLQEWFKRTATLFTVATNTDTDIKEPGLPSTHHVLLAYMAAIPYCQTYKKDRVPLFEKKVDAMKKTLIKHYAHREKDRKKIIKPRKISFR